MSKIYNAALIGCGDYLRWEIDKLNASQKLKVKLTFDLDNEKSKKRANELSAKPVDSADAIFSDGTIDLILCYTPPWVRIPYIEKAVNSGKHVITTKPLAPNLPDAQRIVELVNNKIDCAVFYRRSGEAVFEKLKQIFESGEIGKLAIYKEDWFHHYPQWNDWATDPEKNGGPFMDAMVHNLNIARYLIGTKTKFIYYASVNHAQNLKCNDTESMKVYFENGAMADLFITWAADLEVFALDGNEREHYGINHMITNKGWYVSINDEEGIIRAKKEKEIKKWKIEDLECTAYDDFIEKMENNIPQNSNLQIALEDIKIMEEARKNLNTVFQINI